MLQWIRRWMQSTPGEDVLGSRGEKTGGAALHTPRFDVDEQALRIGAKILARAAVLWAQAAQLTSNNADGDMKTIPSRQ